MALKGRKTEKGEKTKTYIKISSNGFHRVSRRYTMCVRDKETEGQQRTSDQRARSRASRDHRVGKSRQMTILPPNMLGM